MDPLPAGALEAAAGKLKIDEKARYTFPQETSLGSLKFISPGDNKTRRQKRAGKIGDGVVPLAPRVSATGAYLYQTRSGLH